jgi:methylated-DNA-protein-cysteine methyltransferase related protein
MAAGSTKPRRSQVALPGTVSWWISFYRVVRRIPHGRVTTYGAVALLAGRPRAARHVGFALAALKESGPHAGVPWHRVLGSRSGNRAAITIKDPMGGAVQRMLLEGEGVVFDDRGAVPLDRFGWPRRAATKAKKKAPAKAKKPARAKAKKPAPARRRG